MGLFDFLKKKKPQTIMPDSAIPENEKKYYQQDSYYTSKVHEGTPFEREVIPFEARKEISFPSKNGLYVAEILLLEYCSYGTYPHPKNGYPGFWWFEYGIRDVGAALRSLEDRGYIRYASAVESLPSLTVAQLKELLSLFGLPVSGNKSVLLQRIQDNIPDAELEKRITERKYKLTDIGTAELNENQYVPYMHKHSCKTVEGAIWGPEFNVWSINRKMQGETESWLQIVHKEEDILKETSERRYMEQLATLDTIDPDLSEKLRSQDVQLEKIKNAEANFAKTQDVDALILFWEKVWKDGGLLFRGSYWAFRLPDLYISQRRYEDALSILMRIEADAEYPEYAEKAKAYIEKIEKQRRK